MLKSLKIAAGIAAVALVVTGCSASDTSGDDASASTESAFEQLIADAQDEGSLTWLTSYPLDPAERAAAAFGDEYGITVEVVRLNSPEWHPKYRAEREAGKVTADVVMETLNGEFDAYIKEGWLAEVDPDSMPAVEEWPAEYLFENTYALINIQPIGIAYNTDLVDGDDLTSWESVLDSEYNSGIVLADPMGVVAWAELFRVLEDEYGEEFLTDFAGTDFQLQPSAVPATQQVAAGEGKIAFPSLFSVAGPLAAQGAPIDMKFFSPTTGVQQFLAMSEGSSSPNASKLFMNFLMTAEGQQALSEGVGASVLDDVEGTVPLPDDYRMPDMKAALEFQSRMSELLGL